MFVAHPATIVDVMKLKKNINIPAILLFREISAQSERERLRERERIVSINSSRIPLFVEIEFFNFISFTVFRLLDEREN